MQPIPRRKMLQLTAAGVGAGALAVAGSHVPDVLNQLVGEDVDLSGFDEAYVLNRDTGLYTRSQPKAVGDVEKVVDLRGLNRSPDVGLDAHHHHHELETPDWLSESIDRYTSLFQENPGYEAKVFLGDRSTRGPIPGGTAKGEAWWFPVWPLAVSGGTHYGPVGGCVGRNINHADFRVTQYGGSTVYVGIHIASWYANGQQCFGIYESRTGWSYCRCVPKIDFWAMAYSVNAGIQAALPWYLDNLSWAITVTAVGLVLGALIAIPGVPPPP